MAIVVVVYQSVMKIPSSNYCIALRFNKEFEIKSWHSLYKLTDFDFGQTQAFLILIIRRQFSRHVIIQITTQKLIPNQTSTSKMGTDKNAKHGRRSWIQFHFSQPWYVPLLHNYVTNLRNLLGQTASEYALIYARATFICKLHLLNHLHNTIQLGLSNLHVEPQL